MATYKVLQDIEAEDKFVGPLTLKQFILAGVALVSAYLCFFFLTKHLWFLVIPLVPILLFSGFLAFPWGRDQPTEIWLLAKLRFMLKPRRRIWDQSGMQQLVTITAPKHLEQQYISDNLSQTEVKSRLKALANTIDSRGWAVKNVNVNLFTEPSYGAATLPSTDRLVSATALTQQVPGVDIQAADDMMDEANNPTAQHLDQMVQAATQAHRQEAVQQMQDVRDHKKPAPKPAYRTGRSSGHADKKKADGNPADYWFMNQPPGSKPSSQPKDYATFAGPSPTVHPGQSDDDSSASAAGPLTADEQKLLYQVHQQQADEPVAYGHTPVIEPLGKQKSPAQHAPAHSKSSHERSKPVDHKAHATESKSGKHAKHKLSKQSMTQTPDPAILNLANNDDLSVATIARQANQKPGTEPPEGEVVISLR